MNPGVHNISIEQYHAGPGVSRSALCEFKRSPQHYWYKYLAPDRVQKALADVIVVNNSLEFGNAFHSFVLEPEEFDKRYIVMPKVNRTTVAGKKAYNEVKEKAQGRYVIAHEAHETILAMSRSIDKHPEARSLIEGGFYEKSLYWNDKDTNVLCKVRPDIWHENFICDLKTTSNAAYHSFQRDLYEFSYHIQVGMMQEALKTLYNVSLNNFIFIAVEKVVPHAVAIYTLDEQSIAQGVEEFKSILFEFKQHQTANDWPSYKPATISLPAYAKGAVSI